MIFMYFLHTDILYCILGSLYRVFSSLDQKKCSLFRVGRCSLKDAGSAVKMKFSLFGKIFCVKFCDYKFNRKTSYSCLKRLFKRRTVCCKNLEKDIVGITIFPRFL